MNHDLDQEPHFELLYRAISRAKTPEVLKAQEHVASCEPCQAHLLAMAAKVEDAFGLGPLRQPIPRNTPKVVSPWEPTSISPPLPGVLAHSAIPVYLLQPASTASAYLGPMLSSRGLGRTRGAEQAGPPVRIIELRPVVASTGSAVVNSIEVLLTLIGPDEQPERAELEVVLLDGDPSITPLSQVRLRVRDQATELTARPERNTGTEQTTYVAHFTLLAKDDFSPTVLSQALEENRLELQFVPPGDQRAEVAQER